MRASPDDAAEPAHGMTLDRSQLGIIRDLALQTTGPAPTVQALGLALRIAAPLLGQMFRNTTGGTLRSYLAAQRIERARRLLADHRLLVKQVAALSGFQSTAAFVAAFRRSVGRTPQAYRATRPKLRDQGQGATRARVPHDGPDPLRAVLKKPLI